MTMQLSPLWYANWPTTQRKAANHPLPRAAEKELRAQLTQMAKFTAIERAIKENTC